MQISHIKHKMCQKSRWRCSECLPSRASGGAWTCWAPSCSASLAARGKLCPSHPPRPGRLPRLPGAPASALWLHGGSCCAPASPPQISSHWSPSFSRCHFPPLSAEPPPLAPLSSSCLWKDDVKLKNSELMCRRGWERSRAASCECFHLLLSPNRRSCRRFLCFLSAKLSQMFGSFWGFWVFHTEKVILSPLGCVSLCWQEMNTDWF